MRVELNRSPILKEIVVFTRILEMVRCVTSENMSVNEWPALYYCNNIRFLRGLFTSALFNASLGSLEADNVSVLQFGNLQRLLGLERFNHSRLNLLF